LEIMMRSTRLSLLLLPLFILGVAGCGDSSDGDASTDVVEGDAAAEVEEEVAAPTFNYIPLNDEACEIDEAPSFIVDQAEETLYDLITLSDNYVDTQLEVCTEPPGNRCPGCAKGENPMGDLLDDFSGPLSDYIAQFTDEVDMTKGLKAYFRAALKFPLRFVVVSVTACADLDPGACPEGADTRIVLTQGKRQPLNGTRVGSDHYSIEPESLDKACAGLPLTLYGSREVTVDTDAEEVVTIHAGLIEEAVDDVTFGFVVPLIKDMPPDDEAVTMTDEVLDGWLEELSLLEHRMDVRVRELELIMTITTDKDTGESTGCGRMEGWVDEGMFIDIAVNEAPAIEEIFVETILPKYQDPSHPDHIFGVLSVEMDPGSFTNGIACKPNPCAEVLGTCDADVLELSIESATCALPKPDGFADGDAIDPVCDATTSVDWTVDCAAAGGACDAGACTVTWSEPEEGELILTEIFEPDFYGGSAGWGETWIELTNVSDHALELNDCYVQARPNGAMGAKFTIRGDGPIVVGSGQTYLIGQTLDQAVNGGIAPDCLDGDDTNFAWPDYRAYRMTCGEVIIDDVIWSDWSVTPSIALQLSTDAFDAEANDKEASWCDATEAFGDKGSLGSPSAPNAACP
jgi:hypothetical protein